MEPVAFRLGAFTVEPGADRLLGPGDGARVDLEPKTMAVLLVLAEHSGSVVSSEQLIHLVWHDRPMGENPIYKCIAKLRRALGDGTGESHYIETIPRKGYRLLVTPQPVGARRDDPQPRIVPTTAPVPGPSSGHSGRRSRIGAIAVAVALVSALGVVGITSHERAAAVEVATVAVAHSPGREPLPLAQLPLETRESYLVARSELQERQAGFALRLRTDAAALIAAAPAFADGHALRAIACTLRLVHARQPASRPPDAVPIDAGEALACARQSARRAIELDPRSAEALAATGFLARVEAQSCAAPCDQLGLLDSAQASLEEAVRVDPRLPEAHTWLAEVYVDRGDVLRAAREAEAALALDPLNPVATYEANQFLMAQGRNATVRQRLLPLTRRPDAPAFVYEQLAENALAGGDRDEALRWTGRLAANAASRSHRLQLAVLLARLGRRDEARAALAAAATGVLDTGDDLGTALRAYQLAGGTSAVREYLAQQQRLRRHARDPGAEEARRWRQTQGLAYVLLDEPGRAIPLLEPSLGTDGAPRLRLGALDREADFANALAWSYLQTGQRQRAREVADGTLAALDRVRSAGFDRNPDFAATHALARDLAGEHAQAHAELERLLTAGRALPGEFQADPRWRTATGPAGIALADARPR